jgi:hypothetical protein
MDLKQSMDMLRLAILKKEKKKKPKKGYPVFESSAGFYCQKTPWGQYGRGSRG